MTRMDQTSLRRGDEAFRSGRLRKAEGFHEAAEWLHDIDSEDGILAGTSFFANSAVALYVLSGIASADAVCIRATGRYSANGSHDASIAVLRDAAGQPVAKHLQTLLAIKSRAEYDSRSVTGGDIQVARAAAGALLSAAR
ncbi:hypothetical protein [Leifsonia sp. C5G2]|uniref:hypothetical protein n=1 Tax=Leifsonia sp. C5G2 TaxID=2735269 RepID=UPI0015847257|nr:hypothetical protein [Leifsonia sp. C5G2]NUU06358.1 hypothetical protein [Leifsonia sp. C5G2]